MSLRRQRALPAVKILLGLWQLGLVKLGQPEQLRPCAGQPIIVFVNCPILDRTPPGRAYDIMWKKLENKTPWQLW
jgi:hypothetical protein